MNGAIMVFAKASGNPPDRCRGPGKPVAIIRNPDQRQESEVRNEEN
jgi:hypothetical protein